MARKGRSTERDSSRFLFRDVSPWPKRGQPGNLLDHHNRFYFPRHLVGLAYKKPGLLASALAVRTSPCQCIRFVLVSPNTLSIKKTPSVSLKKVPHQEVGATISEAYTSSFLSQHSGIVRTELEGKEVGVVIRDSNIQEKFVRIAGIPQNIDLGVVQTRLKNFGNVIEARWERYRVAEDEVLYPVLATWMIVRMMVTKNIPSYITIGSYRAMLQLPDIKTKPGIHHCPKPVPKMTKKTETIKQNPVVIPLAKHSMVSKVPLESELQDSPSGGTQNLETETMECNTLTSSLTVPSEDNPSKPIMKSQMTAPDTETQDQEPITIIMESMEPDMGEIETMGPDKTKDPLRIPTVPRNKRFKPTYTA
ncbi:hypothetical protein OUZ56_033311 [Daphnia magna]|uniref:Uncharacterized protein n=1 Tax=Daphnia magna TaxID=35525 RepID=A0ABR0BAL5_9CRUS|nr:hypothetical protein OUZ56_033311 [Daphnia magna]